MKSIAHPSWPGWSAQSTLVLPLTAAQWPPPAAPVELDGIAFAPKRELHVTLIGRRLSQQLRSAPGGARYANRAVRAAFDALDWRFSRSEERYRLEKRELASQGSGRRIGAIIELIDLPAMADFHARLGELLGRPLAVPPAHVTLYTAGRARGIGLPDEATLRRLAVRRVAPRELAAGEPPAPRPRPRPRGESHAHPHAG